MPNDWYVRRLPAGVPVCPHIEDGVVRPFVAWVPTEASARGMAAFHANVTMRRGFQGLVMRHAPLIVCHIPRFSPRSGSGGSALSRGTVQHSYSKGSSSLISIMENCGCSAVYR